MIIRKIFVKEGRVGERVDGLGRTERPGRWEDKVKEKTVEVVMGQEGSSGEGQEGQVSTGW